MERFDKMVELAKLDSNPYQRDGVQWCLNMEDTDKGGIIADEMGLGKTITMIGTIVGNLERRTLVVVPVVLLEQWATQFKRLTGRDATIYHGPQKSTEKLASARFVLTTYGMITVDSIVPVRNDIHKVRWNRIVFDEAHHLRNSKTGRYAGAALLNADKRWFMTGTPIQNKMADLISLFMLLGVEANEQNIEKYILRRTKSQVGIKLPKVNEEVVNVPWSDEGEKKLAESIHSGLSFSGVAPSENTAKEHSFVMLTRARQVCAYPPLCPEGKGASKMDAVTKAILLRKNNGAGKLVFCNFRGEIDELAKRLRDGGIESVATFDGRLGTTQREKVLNNKTEVIVLQIQTGCEGLNLQEHFSEVYFCSPNWNPAIEDQAVARCHRIGQTKEVCVFKFVMDGFDSEKTISIDAHIQRSQEQKRKLMFSRTDSESGEKNK